MIVEYESSYSEQDVDGEILALRRVNAYETCNRCFRSVYQAQCFGAGKFSVGIIVGPVALVLQGNEFNAKVLNFGRKAGQAAVDLPFGKAVV